MFNFKEIEITEEKSQTGRKSLHHVIIAGAGPGGLAAALTLQKYNIRTTLLERVSRELLYSDIGGGYDLGPNTLKAMDALGVGTTFRENCDKFPALDVLTAEESLIRTLEFPTSLDAYSVRRSHLQRMLLEKLGEEGLQCEAQVTGFEQDNERVRVFLQTGEEIKGDVLIGADGCCDNSSGVRLLAPTGLPEAATQQASQ